MVLTKSNSYVKLTTELVETNRSRKLVIYMKLSQATEEKEYIIKKINTDDEELNAFLFSLGCYSGEPITVISKLKDGCIVSIKDGRYSFDKLLADAIVVG